jgi:branched-chain amino acid transport system ATP-binding protein
VSLLKLENISQEFGGLLALDHLDLAVEPSDIFGIIGPNGAGKTTLFNLISGVYTPSRGQIWFKDENITRLPTHQIARRGIARTFQNIRLFSYLSVLDNVKVGHHGTQPPHFFRSLLWFPVRQGEKQLEIEADALLERVGLREKRMEYAGSLSYGEQRRLEIARALALRPYLLMLDEPAAGMNPSEKEALVALIRELRADLKLTILLVEHDMHVVMQICERLAVLNYGEKIAEGTPEEIRADQRVIDSYLGG